MNNFYKLLFVLLCLFSFQLTNAQALNFDGVDDYLTAAPVGLTGTQARTIEAWIKTSAANPQKVIVDMGTMPTGNRFTLNMLNDKLRIEVGGNGFNSATSINDNNWHHVAVTYDPTASPNYQLYIDGVSDASGNLTVATNTSLGTNLYIGIRNDMVNTWQGDMHEVRVWDVSRTPAEIAANMNTEFCDIPSSLVAYYKFNDGMPGMMNTNTTTTDLSANGNDASFNGFALSGSSSNYVTSNMLSSIAGTDNITVSECSSFTGPSGTVYTATGLYADTFAVGAGCDSVLNIDLTITGSAILTNEDLDGCDSVMVAGNWIYNDSAVVQNFVNGLGCDSIHTTNVTVNNSIIFNEDIEGCDSVMVAGTWYFTSQVLSVNGTTAAGCDSIVNSIITINNSTSVNETVVNCGSYTHPNGTTYNTSGIYMNAFSGANGCDSTYTLDLTINYNSTVDVVTTSCGPYQSPGGLVYTSSGTYNEEVTNGAGCTSFYTINLTIENDIHVTIDTTVCESYVAPDGMVYSNSGNYTSVITSGTGCDSIYHIDLTVTGPLNVTVGLSGQTLSANQTGATYQWIDCSTNTPIAGATSQTYSSDDEGSFAVIVSNGDCMDTTACYTIPMFVSGVNDLLAAQFTLYPVPSSDFITINNNGIKVNAYTLFNAMGTEIKRVDGNNNTISTSNLPNGLYFLFIDTEEGNTSKKVLIQH